MPGSTQLSGPSESPGAVVAIEPSLLSPQERLAASRRALVAELHDPGGSPWPYVERETPPFLNDTPPQVRGPAHTVSWEAVARSLLRRWWRRHPANAVGQLAKPVLARYAREQPAKLVAAAAATGALVVLVRPWRLLSVTAVLAAVMKTSDVADLVNTLMQNNSNPRKERP